MNIVISFLDRRPCEHLAYVARRAVQHALDRFATRIRDITVKIRDVNGDKGGEDQRCTLAVRTVGGREFFLHDLDSSPASAVHRLARRAARLVKTAATRRKVARR
ncbi:MAG: HPF/RaiA family ribosome-associated protein [Planctomycetes bacterium]|nr:HPF/RaiA family ribosome-associated protein [Planctomycetota bacterium]